MTSRDTRKLWISPENVIVPLTTLHFHYFGDPAVALKYNIECQSEILTRLAALRVGFVRINYTLNQGKVTIESMRWNRTLRNLIDQLLFVNADLIDIAQINILNEDGQAREVGRVCFMSRRQAGIPIDRLTLGSWNNFRTFNI